MVRKITDLLAEGHQDSLFRLLVREQVIPPGNGPTGSTGSTDPSFSGRFFVADGGIPYRGSLTKKRVYLIWR